jgi:hypothetical protein
MELASSKSHAPMASTPCMASIFRRNARLSELVSIKRTVILLGGLAVDGGWPTFI